MPYTVITSLVSTLTSLGCWVFVTHRLKANPSAQTFQARLLALSFLFSIFYGIFMLAPHILLFSQPAEFPRVMAICFVIGHAFLYVSFMQMLRLAFSMVPRLSKKEYLGIGFVVLAAIAMVVLATKSMVLGSSQPSYDTTTRITTYNVPDAVNLLDSVVGLLAVVPAGLLLLYNGFQSTTMRLRSFLIGFGIIALMITGPMVEGSHAMKMVIISNSLSVTALVILTIGVAYKIDQKLSIARSAPAKRRR